MTSALNDRRADARSDRMSPRRLAMLAPWRLQVAGYTLAAAYVGVFVYIYNAGIWLVDSNGMPLALIDFKYWWVGGTQALHGNVSSIYDPAQFKDMLVALVGSDHAEDLVFVNFAYPPIIFLILAPLPMLPYSTAFLLWEAVPLLACVAVVFLIVRRPPAIALALASPFGAINVFWAQTAFLRAALLGAALLALERRPALAGVFIGCLTFKPQFGILIPVALLAARQWRALASAAVTAAFLIAVSIAAFGIEPWIAFPRGFFGNAGEVLLQVSDRKVPWTWIQTVYGLFRTLQGSAALAWLAQGSVAAAIAVIVWLVWRYQTRYELKAALLSAAVLIATPYEWADDLTVIAVPIAFLAKDQINRGLMRGEQTILVALFGMGLALLLLYGTAPLGPVISITLVGVILRRVLRDPWVPGPAGAASRLPEACRDFSLRP
jgi:arabinofuranan 3-O-arabinosyltransferase